MASALRPAVQGRQHRLTSLLRQLPRETTRGLRHHDLLLYSGGVTFYAAIAVVPLLLTAAWAASAVVGPGRMRRLGLELNDALPTSLGAGETAQWLVSLGVGLHHWPRSSESSPPASTGRGCAARTASWPRWTTRWSAGEVVWRSHR